MELQRLSGGRAFCGIDTGDLALIEMGEKPFRMDGFVRYAKAMKDLAGEPAEGGARDRVRAERAALTADQTHG